MKIKNNIANYITSLNLLCGSVAIYYLYHGEYMTAVYLILAAAIFDFADGFVARLLHIKSELGTQLDSLADVISFGLAPGVAVFQLLLMNMDVFNNNLPIFTPFIAFLIPVFSAWRLAKFNIDDRQTDHFIGLPTPANALVIISLLPIASREFVSDLFPWNEEIFNIVTNPYVLIAATLVLSFLLVSELPLIAMKFKTFGWKGNEIRYLFIIISVSFNFTILFRSCSFYHTFVHRIFTHRILYHSKKETT